MAILQVRDIDEELYDSLKTIAKNENRSLSQQVVVILEEYVANPEMYKRNPTDEFLALSSAWQGQQSAEEIIRSIKQSRTNSKRFKSKNVLFD